MKLNSSTPVTLAGAKEILKAREGEGELGYEQKQALDYAEKFSKHSRKDAEKLIEKIMENKKITREAAVTLVNVAPKNPAQARTVAVRDKIDLTEQEAAEVVKLF